MIEAMQRFDDNLFRLDGKVAVVTGGVGILGRGYCRALAERGAEVVVADIDQSACDNLAALLSAETGAKVRGLAVDLSSETSIVDWSKAILDSHGRVDVLMNNAAAKAKGFFAPLESYSLQTWNEVMTVNVDAVFLAVRELGPGMAERGNGSIINVASIYGVVGPDQRIYEGSWYEDLGGAINTPMIYAATKGAIISMTRYLATYWGSKGVRCNCLTPGGVASGQNEEFDKRYSERVPMGRMAKANEMMGAMIYLASDASTYVNGQNIIVDGGWTAW
ncbi:MAG TPA: SDR family oxidoreductase [Nitrospira sp.]|nr:SDR family oxidoreductase [Nitrospira sp.]HNI69559.1 SDR family oxidoreductase [Nitrospira sp.]